MGPSLSTPAFAAVLHVGQCTGFSIGGFCPVDTIFASMIALAVVGVPILLIRIAIARGAGKDKPSRKDGPPADDMW